MCERNNKIKASVLYIRSGKNALETFTGGINLECSIAMIPFK